MPVSQNISLESIKSTIRSIEHCDNKTPHAINNLPAVRGSQGGKFETTTKGK